MLTVPHVEAWQPEAYAAAAAAVAALIQSWAGQMSALSGHESELFASWHGQAADAASARMQREHALANTALASLEQLEQALQRTAGVTGGAKANLVAKVTAARAAGYVVDPDGGVRAPQKLAAIGKAGGPAAMMAGLQVMNECAQMTVQIRVALQSCENAANECQQQITAAHSAIDAASADMDAGNPNPVDSLVPGLGATPASAAPGPASLEDTLTRTYAGGSNAGNNPVPSLVGANTTPASATPMPASLQDLLTRTYAGAPPDPTSPASAHEDSGGVAWNGDGVTGAAAGTQAYGASKGQDFQPPKDAGKHRWIPATDAAEAGRMGKVFKGLGHAGFGAGAAISVYDGIHDYKSGKLDGGDALTEVGGETAGGAAGGALAGAATGMFAGPVGVAVGAGIGAAIGSEVGKDSLLWVKHHLF